MHCPNCGAPLASSSDGAQTCPYCGIAEDPEPRANSVGALVDQLIAQVESGKGVPGSVAIRDVRIVQQATFSVNGKQYESLEQLPADLRQAAQQGLAMAERFAGQSKVNASVAVGMPPKALVANPPIEVPRKRSSLWVTISLIVLLVSAVAAVVLIRTS